MPAARVVSVLVVLSLATTSCRDRKAKPTAVPPPAPVVVVTDPAEIQAARAKWAAEREQMLANLLRDPTNFQAWDDESVEVLRSQRQRSVEGLTHIRDDDAEPAVKRVSATVALKQLDVAPDPEKLARLAADPAAAQRLLSDLHDLYRRGEELPPPLRRVVTRAVGSDDEQVAQEAAHAAATYRVTEAADAVMKRATSDPEAGAALLRAAAALRPDGQTLDLLLTRLARQPAHEAYFTVGAVAELAKAAGDPAVRRRAADACAKYVKSRPDEPGIDGATLSALETVATAVAPDEAKPMLADLARTAPHRLVRHYALAELQKLDSAQARQLSSELKISPAAAERAKGDDGLTPQQAAAVCVRHKVLTQAEADAALAALAARRTASDADDDDETPEDGVFALLHGARRFLEFDTETGMSPNRHDQLILEFAGAGAGQFKPEAVLETYTPDRADADTGKYAVQFICGGRLYRFEPRDLGDWYDVEAVLAAVNRALKDDGSTAQFVPLSPNGQFAEVVFADPAALKAAAPELRLEISTDPDDARKQGRAYEQGVIGTMKDE
jgi:hypothetical protein